MGLVSQDDRSAGLLSVVKNLPRQAFTAAQTLPLWTPASGKKVNLRSFHLTTSGATVLTLKIGTTVIWEGDFSTNWPMQDTDYPDDAFPQGATNEVLSVTSSAAVTVGASAHGFES